MDVAGRRERHARPAQAAGCRLNCGWKHQSDQDLCDVEPPAKPVAVVVELSSHVFVFATGPGRRGSYTRMGPSGSARFIRPALWQILEREGKFLMSRMKAGSGPWGRILTFVTTISYPEQGTYKHKIARLRLFHERRPWFL